MRIPRVRLTIGRLMVVVPLAGLALWALLQWLTPTIAERQALATYQQAKLVREVAEYTVKGYEQGIYLLDKATYQGQIVLARSDKERAIDRLKWSTEMFAKGRLSKAANIADQLTTQRAAFDLEQAETQLKVLEAYTKEKQMKSLRSDVEKARAVEKAKLAAYQLERARRLSMIGF